MRAVLRDGCLLARVQIHLRLREYTMANSNASDTRHGLDVASSTCIPLTVMEMAPRGWEGTLAQP